MDRQEIELTATKENLNVVMSVIDEYLDTYNCPMKNHVQINVAVDEIYSNVSLYAYVDGDAAGPMEDRIRVSIEHIENGFVLEFVDGGIPYNPLEKEDPDVTLSAHERQIGGLGVFIVKKTMDKVEYARENELNIVTLTKYVDSK